MKRRTVVMGGVIGTVLGAVIGSAPIYAVNPSHEAEPTKTIIISGIQGAYIHQIGAAVLRQAYARMGYTMVYRPQPGETAVATASQGQSDGDIARIAAVAELTSLVKVAAPVMSITVAAFALPERPGVRGWADLNGRRIGILRGVKVLADRTIGFDRMFANSVDHLFLLLRHHRIDVAVTTLAGGTIAFARLGEGQVKLQVSEPLLEMPLFHMLNKKHRNLAPRLATVLTAMAKSGELTAIRTSAIHQLSIQ